MKVIANRRGAWFSGMLLLLGFIVLVVLIAGWFLARTQGVRELLESKLSDRVGMKVTIGENRIGWPYRLVLRDVKTDGFEAAGSPGFSIGEARIGRRLFTWQIELRHVAIRVKRDESGVWTPLIVARLADLRQASAMDLVRLTEPVRQHLRLQVLDGAFDWLDAEGRTEASLRDVRFRMAPVRLPERRHMTYYRFNVYAASGGALGDARDLKWVWLTSDELAYIELERAARYHAVDAITNLVVQEGMSDVD